MLSLPNWPCLLSAAIKLQKWANLKCWQEERTVRNTWMSPGQPVCGRAQLFLLWNCCVCVHNCEGFFLLFHIKVETFSPHRESDPVPRHYRPAHIFSCSLFWNRQLLIFFYFYFFIFFLEFAPFVHFMVQKPFFCCCCSAGQDVRFWSFYWLASTLACLQNGNGKTGVSRRSTQTKLARSR